MEGRRNVVSIILVIGILATILSACVFKSDQELIEDRMNAFLKAYNSGDLDAVLECLDAKARNTYKSAMGIGTGLLGLTGFSTSFSNLFGLSIGLIQGGDALRLENMEIKINSDSYAIVKATMYYQDLEQSYSEDVRIKLIKEDGDWFICG